MSLSGLDLIISVGLEERKEEDYKYFGLIAAISNVMHIGAKEDGTLYTADDFLKDNTLDPEEEELMFQAKAAISAANALRMG